MITATIYEVKTRFSELVKKAQTGETVIITSGRAKTPVAKLEAIRPTGKKRLGARLNPNFVMTDAFWEPLPDEDHGTAKASEGPTRHAHSSLGDAYSRFGQQ